MFSTQIAMTATTAATAPARPYALVPTCAHLVGTGASATSGGFVVDRDRRDAQGIAGVKGWADIAATVPGTRVRRPPTD